MFRKNIALLLAVSLSLVLISTPIFGQGPPWPPPPGFPCPKNCGVSDPCAAYTGGASGEQLVKALDAAYVRVLNPAYRHGKLPPQDSYWDIAKQEGIADKNNITVFDCYPYVDETKFPTWAEVNATNGLLKCILVNKKIRFGSFDSDPNCVTSSSVGTTASARTLRAIIDEIGDYYGVSIAIEKKFFSGGPYGMFLPLQCNCVDMISNVHSLGAVTVGRLRREIALHTCTIRASQHVLLVRQNDWATGKYRTVGDLVDDKNAEICGGDLDNHVIRSLFSRDRQFRADCTKPAPVPNPDPDGFHDIGVCVDRMKGDGTGKGESAAIFHWDPTLKVPGLKTIQTPVVGGTPYWVKK